MEDVENVLLVVNPIAGDTDKSGLIRQVEEYTARHDLHLTVYNTTGHQDKQRITELLNTFQAHRVLIAGGDGTIKLIAEVLRNQTIPMGILPTGSANGLAQNLALPADLNEALDVAMGDHFIDIDAICVNNHLCLHISDLGLNAELIKHYEAGSIRGKLGYFLQSIPTLIESEMPFKFEVTAGDTSFRREGILLAITNARQYGTGATINPAGKLDDGKFEVLVFKNFDVIEIFKTLQEDTELDPDFVEFISTSRARVHCQQPVPFQIDGEYYGEVQDLNISILHKHIRIAVERQIEQHGEYLTKKM